MLSGSLSASPDEYALILCGGVNVPDPRGGIEPPQELAKNIHYFSNFFKVHPETPRMDYEDMYDEDRKIIAEAHYKAVNEEI